MERKGLPAAAGPVRSMRGNEKKQPWDWKKNNIKRAPWWAPA